MTTTTTPLTLAQMTLRLGTGINIGNVFDRQDLPRDASFVSPLLKAAKDKGFQHVRIPVTFYPDELNGACRLSDPVFMQQLDSAVYYSVALGLVVVVDTHHENWLCNKYDGSAAMKGKFWQLWKDIATRYRSIAQKDLVFELLNEPHGTCLGDWNIGNCNTATCLQNTRDVMKCGFDGVRAVDSTRFIMLSSNAMQSYSQCGALYSTANSLPGAGLDRYLYMAVHNYEPCSFTLEWGSNSYYLKQTNPFGAQQNDITKYMDTLVAWQKQLGGPTVIGIAITEFGIGDINSQGGTNPNDRRNCDLCRTWFREVARGARARGFTSTVWADVGWFSLCKRDFTWVYGLADCVLNKA